MYVMGFDIGSTSSKVVILNGEGDVVSRQVVGLGTGSSGPQKVLASALGEAGIDHDDIDFTVATGYGRTRCEFADKNISEISCHAKGVAAEIPGVRTIVDIGGQDAKAIFLDSKGRVEQFFMNDKCAAGTGRFLEVMARVLETSVSDMAVLGAMATEIAPVSSTCTVFAESEVISLLSNGIQRENIIAGVHQSVATKAASLVSRGPARDPIVMSGGVAQNAGVVEALERELCRLITVAPNSQTVGAYGAAVYALEEAKRKNGKE